MAELQIPELLYGADYNPEQWDEQTFEEDLKLMQEAGVNMVSLGIFSWAKLEPEEGRYDFDWLVGYMDRLHETGIMVDLATGTASPPVWLARNYPETLPMNAQGQVLGFGSRQQYVPASLIFREKCAGLVRALAERVKDHPALKLWHVSNEYGCHIFESFDPVTIQAFQTWLAKRYQNIEALNHTWNTNFWSQHYQDFSQVGAPDSLPTFHNPAHRLDWRRFSSDMLIECLENEVQALREVTPEIPITTNFMGLFPPIDYWKMAQHLDLISDDTYPDPTDRNSALRVAMDGDLMRSLGGGKPYLLMEQTTAGVQWRPEGNAVKRPGTHLLWSTSRLASGARGILYFQWRQSPGGAEAMHSAMVPHSGKASYIWDEVCEHGRLLKDLSALGSENQEQLDLTTLPVEAKVAIVLDWEALWAAASSIGPADIDVQKQLRNWYKTCYEAGQRVDFVRPGDDLSRYQVVIVVAQMATSQGLEASLTSATEAGAQVIITAPFGVYDQDLRVHLGGYHGPFSRFTGVKVTDVLPKTTAPCEDLADNDPRTDRITSVIYTPGYNEPILIRAHGPLSEILPDFDLAEESQIKGGVWAERVQLENESVKVLAEFAPNGAVGQLAGSPALTVNPCGKGQVWYSATDLDNLGRALLLELVGQEAGLLQPDWLPAGLEIAERGGYVFYLNHGELTQTLPEPVMDLVSGETVDTIEPRQTVIVRN
ncbi:hypothetical protein BSR28_07305 [Boudabousia liubingyangii]|uniref:beta-galactosidase n=1 Tax=Boudabousia liubingyangii TaxID=1921764 RepID=UPI00093F9F4A|nr:beta-galactosidase [Boudabousia liubingyangii]OKL46334.1 hypothetical protein BSR28_07305 [Boudabousia liubingyangii]